MGERTIDVLVETPKGSRKKYEWDHEREAIRLDRRLFAATVYPADYGFTPGATGGDGEDLDVLVLTDEPTFPGCWVRARPVAVVWISYGEGSREAKIIAVPENDPTWSAVHDVTDLPPHVVEEIEHFFEVYKELEPATTPSVVGLEGVEAANQAIDDGRDHPGKSG